MASTGNFAVFDSFQPVETKRACEAIFEQVRSLIASGELKPGDRLPSERNMMEMFHRSRPTIREALRMLERSGYIHTIAGSNGAIVMEPNNRYLQQTMQDALQIGHISLEEMSEYRQVSEAATVAWAARRATKEDLDALQDVVDRMAALTGDYPSFIDLDPVFHGLLAVAAKNQVSMTMNQTFSKLYRSFLSNKMNFLNPEESRQMCEKILSNHADILSAVRDHDIKRAQAAMADHLASFENDLRLD